MLNLLGKTTDGQAVVGGAFFLHDTKGYPLAFQMEQGERQGFRISIPHFFAAAIEHGWTNTKAFAQIREALQDNDYGSEYERCRLGCVALFMQAKSELPGERDAQVIARRMREKLEG